MAKFIVLRNGLSHKVFDFDGNIARVGSGSAVDLMLETPGIEGDLFFLTKSSAGYEIEKRARELSFTINGASAEDRTLLKEGDKVGFLDYIMIATYPQQAQPTPRIESKQTAPSLPAAESKPVPPPPQEEKPKAPPKGGERPTMIIDSSMLSGPASATPRQEPPPPVSAPPRSSTKPAPMAAPKAEPSKSAGKKKITPVYSLVGLTGQHKGKTIFIDTEEFMVGRDRSLCDLVIDHDERGQMEMSVSREHFVIHSTNEGLYITDKRSQLRTYVNRKVLEADQREFIAPEDVISIPAPSGEIFFRLCFAGQENFAPIKAGESQLKMILVLASAIVILIVVLVLLLR